MAEIRHYPALGYSVTAAPASHWVDFVVHAHFGQNPDGTPVFRLKHDGPATEPCDDIESAEVFVHGTVKWDGCSDWHFDEQERGTLHECGRTGLVNIGNVMAICWDWAAELLPNFDGRRR